MKRSDPKHGIFAMLAFAGICFLLALNINGRTGQILFSRPIVDEEEWVEENWAEYKQDAAIAFFGSDTSLLREKYVSHGYSSFDDWNPVGYTIYQNKLFLLFCSLSIIVLSANMAGRKTGDSAIDRMSRYAAAGWLMRTMLVILLAATMTPTDWLVLPFSMECFLELFVLAGFLRLRPLLSLVFPKKRLDIAQTGFQ